MPEHILRLTLLPEDLMVVRLNPSDPIPAWALAAGSLVSITRTADELSIICPSQAHLPESAAVSAGWRALRFEGPFAFDQVGVMAAVAAPLAQAGVSILALATYDTDYLLVKNEQLPLALQAVRAAGHHVRAD
jgi:hypothetical protein